MIDLVALLEARDQTASLARSALPDAPVQPDRTPSRALRVAPSPARSETLRRQLGAALRRLADRIEPAPAPASAVPCR